MDDSIDKLLIGSKAIYESPYLQWTEGKFRKKVAEMKRYGILGKQRFKIKNVNRKLLVTTGRLLIIYRMIKNSKGEPM